MLIPPKEPAPNPYEPFVYANQEIRHVDDRGDRYDADVWQTRPGWRWSASYAHGDLTGDNFADTLTTDAEAPVPTEPEAVTAAATWLRRFLPTRVGA